MEVTVLIMVLDSGEVVVNVENVVEGERSNEVVFEKNCNCEDVEDELPRDVMVENIGGTGESVANTEIVVGNVITSVVAVEKILVVGREREDGLLLTKIVVAAVAISVRTSVEVNSTVVVGAVVLGERNEDAAVVFAYGPDVGIANSILVLRAVLFVAEPGPMNPGPLRGG